MAEIEQTAKELIKSSLQEVDLSDEVVNTYFTLSKDAILLRRYPFGKPEGEVALPSQYLSLCVRLAVYMYNKQGAEGETSHSENGVAIHWENGDLPESLMSEIIPLAKGM